MSSHLGHERPLYLIQMQIDALLSGQCSIVTVSSLSGLTRYLSAVAALIRALTSDLEE